MASPTERRRLANLSVGDRVMAIPEIRIRKEPQAWIRK